MRLGIESSSARSARDLRMVELCFQYSFLVDKQQSGELAVEDEPLLMALGDAFVGDSSLAGRRAYRRHATYLPAAVSGPSCGGHAILLNISNAGMFVATRQVPAVGAEVHVKVGQPERLEYLFTCRVLRTLQGRGLFGLGCCFSAAPIELRFPSGRATN